MADAGRTGLFEVIDVEIEERERGTTLCEPDGDGAPDTATCASNDDGLRSDVQGLLPVAFQASRAQCEQCRTQNIKTRTCKNRVAERVRAEAGR